MTINNLSVVVVGGGIGGLSAAIALRRAGHQVKILERSSYAAEVGAAITVPPNATRILERWGMDFKKACMNPYSGMYLFTADEGSLDDYSHSDFSHMQESFGSPYLLSHRVDLHEGLQELASGKGDGRPVEIVTNSQVSGFNADEGTVHFYNGNVEKTLQADLIIAADGVRSKACEALGVHNPVFACDTTVIRFLIPTEEMLNDPVTAPLLQHGDNQGSMYVTADKKRWLFRYPCRNNTLQNFGLYSIDPNSDYGMQQQRRFDCDHSDLLHAMRGFHPTLRALADKTDEILPLWLCTEREPLPRYTHRKLALLGDAAHAMLPHIGQGAAQAIEDAGALGVLFSGPQDDRSITERLQIYDKIRRDRATGAQILSHVMVWDQGMGEVKQQFQDAVPGITVPDTKTKRHAFCYGHDIMQEAAEALSNHSASNGV